MSNQMIELKKVVEGSETSTLIKEWGNLFSANIQTQRESTEFMQALTNVLVSNISRGRSMFSSSYYSEKTLGRQSVFVRRKKFETDTVLFDMSISSALQEIPSQYMKKLYLEIINKDGQVFEYFTIRYKYLTKSSCTESNFTDIRELQDSTVKLLKELNQRASVWPMINLFKIQIRITYYEDEIPPGYTPELFTTGPAPDRRSLPNFRRELIGLVRTGHHVLGLEAATTQNFNELSQLNLIVDKKMLSDISSNSSTVKLPAEKKMWPIVQTPTTSQQSDGSENNSQCSKVSTKKQLSRKCNRTQLKRKKKNESSQLNHSQQLIADKKILSDISSNSSTVKLPAEKKMWPIVQTPTTSQQSDGSENNSQSSKVSTKKQSSRKCNRTQLKRKKKNIIEPPVLKLSKLIEETSEFERFKLSTIPEESTVHSLRSTIEETDEERIEQTAQTNTPESDNEIIPATPPEVPQREAPLNRTDSVDLAFATDLTYKKNITPQALKEFFEKEISLSESEFRCYCKFSVRVDLFICQHCQTLHHRACYNVLPKMAEPKNWTCIDCAIRTKSKCTHPKLMQLKTENEPQKLINYGRYCRLRASLYDMDELRTDDIYKNYGLPKDVMVEALRALLSNNVIKPSNVKNVFIVNKMPYRTQK